MALPQCPTLQTVLADGTYGDVFWQQVQDSPGLKVQISRKAGQGIVVEPKRWIAERFLAWPGNSRRLSKDYELTVLSAENFIRLAALRRILRLCAV